MGTVIDSNISRREFAGSALRRAGIAAAAVALGGCATRHAQPVAIESALAQRTRSIFRPPAGKVLFIAGQDSSVLGEYLNHMPARPGGFTLYCSVFSGPDLRYLSSVCDLPALRDSVLHLSVGWIDDFDPKMTDNNRAITAGAFDENIDRLANWCAKQPRPILMRIGFEFDRQIPFPNFHYNPDYFADGFRRIVDRLRAAGAVNVATVLGSTNVWPPLTIERFDRFYPGDDYVDWLGFSTWNPVTIDRVILSEARKRGKPILLAETTPTRFNIGKQLYFPLYVGPSKPATPQTIWDGWHQPMIEFIRSNIDVIAAWHYIAEDWSADSMWNIVPIFCNCDARPWADAGFLEIWNKDMNAPPFLQASPGLFGQLGYSRA
jgi:hypothetical protein